MITLEAITVPLQELEPGVYFVAGTRVPLESVLLAFRNGATPEQIVQDFDTLNLPKVYAILAWALAHPADADSYLNQRLKSAQEMRQQIEKEFPADQLRAAIRSRMKT